MGRSSIGAMQLTVTVDGGSGSALYEALFDWLAGEPELRPVVALEKRAPAAGDLGGMIDAITVVAASGGTLPVLAGSLRAWLSQPRNQGVRVEISEKSDGSRKVVLDARHVTGADVERMLRALIDGDEQ